MSQFLNIQNSYFSILSEDDNSYKVCNVGGGFIRTISKSIRAVVIDELPKLKEEGYFGSDYDITDLNAVKFKGYENPKNLWNGWSLPVFTRRVIEKEIIPFMCTDDNFKAAKLNNNDWFVCYNDEVDFENAFVIKDRDGFEMCIHFNASDKRYFDEDFHLIEFNEEDEAEFMNGCACWERV